MLGPECLVWLRGLPRGLLHCFLPGSKVAQSCPTLCNPMDCSPLGSSVHGNFPGKDTGVGCHFLLQGIFLTQGLNLRLLYCTQMLYHLSHWGRVASLLDYS